MMDNPEHYIEAFAAAGANEITIHVELGEKILQAIEHIKSLGCKAGLSVKPGTPADSLLPYLSLIDLILIMTVEPGFGGQKMMPGQLDKAAFLREKGFCGIISADGRKIGGPYTDFLQIDAPINRGNSGGPAFNLNGEVVGMNAAIYSPSGTNAGLAFSIPSTLVKQVADQLREAFRFYDWDASRNEVRWMCSFDTSEQDVDAFVAELARLT